MNVLLVLDNLSIDSGVTTIIKNLYDNISSIHFDFLIFKDSTNNCVAAMRDKGSAVFVLPSPFVPKLFFKAKAEIKKFFKERSSDYDCVHLNSPTLTPFVLKYAKKYGLKNRIIHSHSSMNSTHFVKRAINNYLTSKVTKYANYYWTCSDVAADFLYGKKFCENHRIELIRNAIDTKQYAYNVSARQDCREEFNIAKDKVVYLMVSNFTAIKNYIFLVPVMKALAANNENVLFLFVGDGQEKENLEKQIHAEGLSRFCLLPGRRKDVSRFLSAADALLMPSLKEGLPVVVVEAQAAGLPCYITDTITKQVNINNVNYLPLEPHAWIAALEKFKPFDDDVRLQKSTEVSNSNFEITTEAKRVEKLYLDLVKK